MHPILAPTSSAPQETGQQNLLQRSPGGNTVSMCLFFSVSIATRVYVHFSVHTSKAVTQVFFSASFQSSQNKVNDYETIWAQSGMQKKKLDE